MEDKCKVLRDMCYEVMKDDTLKTERVIKMKAQVG